MRHRSPLHAPRCRNATVYATLLTIVLAQVGFGAMPSHLGIHAGVLPPNDLTRGLQNGDATLKGLSPSEEPALLKALEQAGLGEHVLKVGLARQGATPVALIKVQAGDAHSRVFALAQIEQDAMACLNAAFSLPLQISHVDFWSVVPEVFDDGVEWHRPVFSVAAERKHFYSVLNGSSRPLREILAQLSAVRYDPVLTRHAADWSAAETNMPRTAYTFNRLKDEWRGMVSDGVAAIADLQHDDSPVSAILGGVPNGGKVALTIDDGPRPLLTPLFLDVLRRENVKATFFIVGEKAEEYPGLIREIARDGHELGNHTYSHQRFSGLRPEEVHAQVRGCSRIIGRLTGTLPKFIRPPGGDYTADAIRVCNRLGLVTALWTHNTGDWARPEPRAIAYNATREIRSGDIILMHQGDMKSVLALPMIIERIRARGLEPGRLSDIVTEGAIRKMSVEEAVAQRARLCLTE